MREWTVVSLADRRRVFGDVITQFLEARFVKRRIDEFVPTINEFVPGLCGSQKEPRSRGYAVPRPPKKYLSLVFSDLWASLMGDARQKVPNLDDYNQQIFTDAQVLPSFGSSAAGWEKLGKIRRLRVRRLGIGEVPEVRGPSEGQQAKPTAGSGVASCEVSE